MTKEELKANGYYSLFGDCYALMSKADKKSMDWTMLVHEADKLGEKWKGTSLEELAFNMINDIMCEMEKF